ncbi:hypothetical protein CPB83DRAFT_846575 [Crepidotus variabilis]|uniref:Uncharacterized protein n=1 Tax=Crepidotus variabilis TaxID=179855 RepID=A0A9P6EPB5_9AGAR|nr:hypothetical protein CPB83DRAFT_846575 [Crepidotus variabilis]
MRAILTLASPGLLRAYLIALQERLERQHIKGPLASDDLHDQPPASGPACSNWRNVHVLLKRRRLLQEPTASGASSIRKHS